MKIAVVSESPADEAAIKILVDAIVGEETDLVLAPRLRPNGWPDVLRIFPNILKALYYNTDAESVAVVVDSNGSPLHTADHSNSNITRDCRVCLLQDCVDTVLGRVGTVPSRDLLKTAVGLAVPAIEAWYSCGIDEHIHENAWIRGLRGERITYSKSSLKISIYGSDRPSLSQETEAATAAATRLASNLDLLENRFPNGFGCFLSDVRGWLE